MPLEWIEDVEHLTNFVDRATGHGVVAVDTELFWERTYYPRLAIVQLAVSDEDCCLVDVPALPDLSPLGSLLADTEVVKILHDAPQDLSILRRATGSAPRNIFDTRNVAGLAGLTSTISLRDLLAELMGVELAKTETRTDWFRRPLSGAQLSYAVDDVRFLHAARLALLAKVAERGVEAWLTEELAQLDDPSLYEERDPRQQLERIKGSGRLTSRELAVLRELAAWRELEARSLDRPRGRVVPDKLLLDLARRRPTTQEALRSVRDIKNGQLRRFGDGILEAVGTGLAVPDEECPPRAPRSRYDETAERRSAAAIQLLEQRSAARGIDHALVATRSEVRSLVRDGERADQRRHRVLRGWRRDFVGAELLALAAGTR